ncbi:unnamed protein product [Clavelina lepadiformis]|uniref:C3H1-type domain-containing protein n=2 Tax=Clavelina lepadiformis TaxID=159417 RepID=A0ABP0G024_CLALP
MESRRSEFQDFPVTSFERTQSYSSGCKVKKSKLCPKYHDEGLCELGPNCNLIHEEKRNYFSTLDPTVPEFLPRTAQKSFMPSENFNHWDDTLSRDENDLALPTGLRKSWILIGSCNFGSKCYFVYGNNGRRPPASVLNFKTKPCTNIYAFGKCPYGDKCTFYHNKEEKNFPFYKNRLCKNLTSSGNCNLRYKCVFAHSADELSVKFKTKFCKDLLITGKCSYGPQCNFAHNLFEKRKDYSTVFKFKTQICEGWINENCPRGSICTLAHGPSELQAPKYLSQP